MNKVTPEVLSEVAARLVDALNPERIYLFGSYAWGEPHEHSDIDLWVVISNANEYAVLSEHARAVRAHTALAGIGIAKDIIVKTQSEFDTFRPVHGSLSHKIATEGKVIYDRSRQRGSERIGASLVTQGT
jgi:uncharacterized protein